jgi:hypothetical protein
MRLMIEQSGCITITGRPAPIMQREIKMMNLMLTDESFLCDDGDGNGCGRMFDGITVKQVRGLCEHCAADLPEESGC